MPSPDFTDRQQLEAFLREQMDSLQEQNKLDFKADLELEKPGGGRNPKGRTNLVRLLSAFANTEDRLFNDHGFLVLGFSTETGQICHVPMLEKGEDKVHPIISHLLEDYLQPVPHFDMHVFEEPDGRKWGCIVLPPGQAVDGPFIFARESSEEEAKWREGEWRVRRHKKVAPPQLEDYRRIELGKINRAFAPFQERVDGAHQRIAQLEAEVRLLTSRRLPALRLEIIPSGEPVEILLTPARERPAMLLQKLRADRSLALQIERLIAALEKANAPHEEPVMHEVEFGEAGERKLRALPGPSRDLLAAVSLGMSRQPLVIPEDVRTYLQKMVMQLLDRKLPDEIFQLRDAFCERQLGALNLPELGIRPQAKLTGSQAPLYEQTLELYRVLKRRYDAALSLLAREQRQERCFSYDLRVSNAGPVKSGELRIELSTPADSEVRLINHVPASPAEVDAYQRRRKERSGIYSVPLSPFEREPVETFEFVDTKTITASSLSPGRDVSGWTLGAYVTPRHDRGAGRPAVFRLLARITSDELPDPVTYEMEAEIEVEYHSA